MSRPYLVFGRLIAPAMGAFTLSIHIFAFVLVFGVVTVYILNIIGVVYIL